LTRLPRHLLRFGLVGALTTGLSFVLFTGLTGLGAHYLAASALAWLAAMLVSFALNKRFTFSLRTPASARETASFVGGSLLQLLMASLGYALLIDGAGLSPSLAFAINLCLVAASSFAFMRLVVFHRALRTTPA
jgi:putative flippase GtrA